MKTRRGAWQNREGHNGRWLWNSDHEEKFKTKEQFKIQANLAASNQMPRMKCRIFLRSDDDT